MKPTRSEIEAAGEFATVKRVRVMREINRLMRDRTFHRVSYDRIPDWLLCGWMIAPSNGPAYHNLYGVMMEWLCDCKMVRPQ